jgi:hypothetical protein
VHGVNKALVNWTLVDTVVAEGLNGTFAKVEYVWELQRFILSMQAGSTVHHLTPDNSHTFLDRIQPLLIALLFPSTDSVTEAEQNSKLKVELLKVAADFGDRYLMLTSAIVLFLIEV